jgi:hypothetical protein
MDLLVEVLQDKVLELDQDQLLVEVVVEQTLKEVELVQEEQMSMELVDQHLDKELELVLEVPLEEVVVVQVLKEQEQVQVLLM